MFRRYYIQIFLECDQVSTKTKTDAVMERMLELAETRVPTFDDLHRELGQGRFSDELRLLRNSRDRIFPSRILTRDAEQAAVTWRRMRRVSTKTSSPLFRRRLGKTTTCSASCAKGSRATLTRGRSGYCKESERDKSDAEAIARSPIAVRALNRRRTRSRQTEHSRDSYFFRAG